VNLHRRLAGLPGVDTWPRRRIAWAGGALIAAIVALAAYDVWRGYRQAVADTRRELDTQSRVIAEQTARSVQAVDVLLRHVAAEYKRGGLARLKADELHVYLRDLAVGLNQIDGVGLFDAAGDPLAVSWPAPRRAVNMVALPRFRQLRDDASLEFVIFGAGRAVGEGHWIVPFGRRLEAPDGRFAGVIAARGSVEYFERFYRDAYPDPATRVALLQRDTTLLARHPASAAQLGQKFPVLEELLPGPDGQPRASRGISPIDGIDRFAAIRLVPDYPLVIVVTREAQAALAGWRSQALGSALRTIALGALATLLLVLLWRQLASLSAARSSLARSEERYALAAAGSDTGVWDWDLVAGTGYESRRARELQGLPLDPETQPLHELKAQLTYHPDDAARRADAMQAHLDGKTSHYEVEYRVRRADGRYAWIHVRALCIRDADGKPLRIAGSVTDIDDRKRAEQALRVSEQRFADAVAGSDDGIWEWDQTTGNAFGSRRGREILGLPPEPEVMPLAQWLEEAARQVHPDDRAARQAAIDDHLAGRTSAYTGDFRARQPDGSYRWVHVHGRAVRDADGKVLRVAGSAKDIDDRRRAEDALRESEERYALAMTGSRGGHWVWNLRSDTLFASERVNELFGLPAEAIVVRRADYESRIRVHPQDKPPLVAIGAELIRGRRSRADFEYRILLPEGERWILTRAQRFEDDDGNGVRIAGVSVDITERKAAEVEHERLEQQLRQAQKLEAIGTLAGGIAHDFNNILSAILGYGELAQKGAAEGSAQRRHIDATLAAAQRAKSLVERILAFSRSGMGERVPVHVQSVVAEALDGIAATLPADVTLERRLAAGDAAVQGDATQIHQVVMNLAANAVQAMHGQGGRLVVTLESVRLPVALAVSTSTLAPGTYVRLAVADGGSGIEPHLLERIFDPFFTTKEVGVGTGLGLSLVHGIVTDLGGGIDVASRVGHGSTFTIHLPAAGVVAAPAAEGPNDELLRGDGQTVMLVDDEEPLVRLGEELLAQLGYEPVGFVAPRAALAALRAQPQRFDVLLSDESMPGLTGCELAGEARRLRADLPVLLMSGFVSPALLQQALALGVADVLGKPLAARDIARALAVALRSAPGWPESDSELPAA
jgi:PAS domain S-box-containing protein